MPTGCGAGKRAAWAVFVRWGKSSNGSPPKRRTVFTVPEMDWIVDVLGHYLTEVRPRFEVGNHPALWVTERCGRLSKRGANEAFETAREAAGLPAELDLHSLRHSMITHLVEFDYPERFVQVLLSRSQGVHDVQHEPETDRNLRGRGGYLPPSITRIPGRFDACAAGGDARLVA